MILWEAPRSQTCLSDARPTKGGIPRSDALARVSAIIFYGLRRTGAPSVTFMNHKDSIANSVSVPSFEGVPASSRASSRPKRTMLAGIESLGDAELVAIVLGNVGSGAQLVSPAAALIDELGVGGLACAGIGELAQRKSIGLAKAVRLMAAIELGRRAMLAAALEAMPCLPDRDAVVSWARPRLATLDHEELWVLLLDGRNGLRAARRVASGGIHGLHVSVRDVLRVAIREAASAFILVHNHPSGDPTPSPEDETFTRAVTEGANVVGCPLLDHVIVARQRSSSMVEESFDTCLETVGMTYFNGDTCSDAWVASTFPRRYGRCNRSLLEHRSV